MKAQRLAIALSAINLVLLVFLAGETSRSVAAQDEVGADDSTAPPMLRGRGLEIVDEQGRVRAMIAVQPPVRVDGKDYPETVLLRLVDPKSGPVVKLTASDVGSGLSLSDDADGGLMMYARDTGNYLKLMDRTGREKTVWP